MGSHRFLVGRPAALLGQTQFVKVFEGKNSGIMAIAEGGTNGVMSDRPKTENRDVFLVQLQHGLIRAVALDLGGGRVYAKVFKREAEDRVIVISNFKPS